MRGIIFRTYLNFIKEKFGYEKLDEILQEDTYPNDGGFSSAGNYSSRYLTSLVSNSMHLYDNSKDKVLEAFGRFSFQHLLDRFKKSYDGSITPLHTNNAYDFLESLNIIHFDELKKLYPEAHFPKFDIQRIDVEHIVIEYSSPRNFPYLVNGLIKGCLEYFNDDSTLKMKTTNRFKNINNVKCRVYQFEVMKNG